MDPQPEMPMAERGYQAEIIKQAMGENLIVCLPTGSGKTFIATKLIEEYLPETNASLVDGGKRIIFLVKTVALAQQHYTTLTKSLDKSFVSLHHGGSTIDLSDENQWNTELQNYHIFIFINQIFLNLLRHGRFSMDKVNLLIFDECHHATNDEPYKKIMDDFYRSVRSSRPRVLGLTASITGQKIDPDKFEKVAQQLEVTFHARIETGSDPVEIAGFSTSAKLLCQRCDNYQKTKLAKEQTISKIIKEIKALSAELGEQKKPKDQIQIKNATQDTNSSPSETRTLDQLKSYLDSILHVLFEVGLEGFILAIQQFQDFLVRRNLFIVITNPKEQELYNKIINKLEDLIKNQFINLPKNREILHSSKVLKVLELLRKNIDGQTIVFVDRVFTAAYLCQVLTKIDETIQVKYIAGSKMSFDEISCSLKYQQKVIEEFRNQDIRVLIATAILEEGMDIPACNLVIRFDKPQNFSAYLQSKGRARAKNAEFVLFHDEVDQKKYTINKDEYNNYICMEKMLKRNFKADYSDNISNSDVERLPPYRPPNSQVNIDAIHAVQIVYQYCAVLGNGQVLSPRFCFYLQSEGLYECVLTMPGNCPIKEDIKCTNRNKRIAKQTCCLIAVKQLHEIKELDDSCLPIRPEQRDEEDEDENDESTPSVSVETIDKQICHFPIESSNQWHLYRVNMPDYTDLGFVVPNRITELPAFKLYTNTYDIDVKIVYLRPIDFQKYRCGLEEFCRYIFENVFIKWGIQSNFKFDIEQSTFKLLPCFLKENESIDCERMSSICNRKDKRLQSPSELNEDEVYIRMFLPNEQMYTYDATKSLARTTSDPMKSQEATTKTYADHFESKVGDIRIERDCLMLTARDFKPPRINYFKRDSDKTGKGKAKSLVSVVPLPAHLPIEVLKYAPLNQFDYELIFRIPCLTSRIAQLSYLEQLRKLLANNIQSYTLLSVDKIPIVSFLDRLPEIFTSSNPTILPLSRLNYDAILNQQCAQQPTPDILFQAITRRSADEVFDMENLEVLGDCFLKLAMSLALYHQYPKGNSGKLTSNKDRQVANKFLHRLATRKDLKNYLYAKKVEYTGKGASWTPPGYTVTSDESDKYQKQNAKQKAFADMIEALIGAFLISTDYGTTIRFMHWLGLGTIPDDIKTPTILYSDLSESMPAVMQNINQFFLNRRLNEVEKTLNYTFKNKAYLISAFTHPSYVDQRLTQCYERLEYLGDAVLDFLVIRCVFVQHYKYVTPSQVTSIRQDISNNGRLANRFVYCDFHTKILHCSLYLSREISIYLKNHEEDRTNLKDKLNNDIFEWADSTAPKALADVFEAVVGAIFLDSGYCLNTVWQIVSPLLEEYISKSVANPNLSPIRSYYEAKGEKLKILPDKTDGYVCYARLPNEDEVSAHGRNKQTAKYLACREAMQNRRSTSPIAS